MSEVERRLLGEADYVYNPENWEVTCNDLSELSETEDLHSMWHGEVLKFGRLKELPPAYAVNVAVSWDDDGDPEEWEVKVFETEEDAKAAYLSALTAPAVTS